MKNWFNNIKANKSRLFAHWQVTPRWLQFFIPFLIVIYIGDIVGSFGNIWLRILYIFIVFGVAIYLLTLRK